MAILDVWKMLTGCSEHTDERATNSAVTGEGDRGWWH